MNQSFASRQNIIYKGKKFNLISNFCAFIFLPIELKFGLFVVYLLLSGTD